MINGLLDYPVVNVQKRKAIAETSREFFEFIQKNIVIGEKYNKRDVCTRYNTDCDLDTKQKTFTQYLRKYAEKMGLDCNENKSGDDYFFTLRILKK